MTSVWVVIPTYDEAANVRPLVAAVRGALAFAAPNAHHRILIVDDASPDGTGEIADALARAHPGEVRVLHRPGKTGLGRAYVEGMTHALEHGADVVVQMDADFSHDPADIVRLLGALADGADVAIGTRYMPGGGTDGWSRGREAVSRLGGTYARAVLGLTQRDLTGGFKAFRRSALAQLDLESTTAQGYAFQVEVTLRAARAGLQIDEVPIVFRERREGDSKMRAAIALEALWRIPALRLQRRSVARSASMPV